MKDLTPILLLTDLEGIIGVISMKGNNAELKQLAKFELDYIITKLNNNGFNRITIADIHNFGNMWCEQDYNSKQVRVLQGIDKLVPEIHNFKYAIMLGFHGRYNSGGRFDHTFRYDIEKVYYGSFDIGEVGAYYRWLIMSGVKVIMVSGEGTFQDEINGFPCIIHNIKKRPNSKEDIQNEYKLFGDKLDEAIASMKKNKMKNVLIPSEKIFIKMKNTDICKIIDKTFYKLENEMIVFDTIHDFFVNIYNLAMNLNRADDIIYKTNKNFIIEIKKNNIERSILEPILACWLKKSLFDINSEDRQEIAAKLGMKYDAFEFT